MFLCRKLMSFYTYFIGCILILLCQSDLGQDCQYYKKLTKKVDMYKGRYNLYEYCFENKLSNENMGLTHDNCNGLTKTQMNSELLTLKIKETTQELNEFINKVGKDVCIEHTNNINSNKMRLKHIKYDIFIGCIFFVGGGIFLCLLQCCMNCIRKMFGKRDDIMNNGEYGKVSTIDSSDENDETV